MDRDHTVAGWSPRPEAIAPTIEGRYVRIAPLVLNRDAPMLWTAFEDANALMRFFSWPHFSDVHAFRSLLETQNENGHMSTACFWVEERPVGMASYMRRDAANGSVEVGAVAHGPGLARTPAATEAHYLLARHVFETLGYRRYEWKCDSRNEESRRAAVRLGFTYEGTFRQHAVVKGENRDTAWYSMLDSEWPLLDRAACEWLDPANFDEEGRQRRRLEDVRAQMGIRSRAPAAGVESR